ncbi:MAG: single-stranded-DNA-specific exonuclease RecJ [Clostridia bacterium]|nr:single-stranded-DNA-specific exonuclease RecJ [Clostridia bacterium]
MTDKELSVALGISPLIGGLLVERGYTTVESAMRFLYPKAEHMIPAERIRGMSAAVARIREAIDAGERILVFGDYDCDGICATSILVHYLRSQGADTVYHIPRREDGYGLSELAVERVVGEHFPDLMVTVDCGIASPAEVAYAQDLGVDVIVTDHHEPQEELPDCILVNPKLGDEEGLRDICGAAVALKLVEALSNTETACGYLDLACIATIADVVPLVGENRVIASLGLKALGQTKRPGLRALLRSCEAEKPSASDVGFRIAPRLNALGRMNDTTDVVELFMTEEAFVIGELVARIEAANTARQSVTKTLLREAEAKLIDYDLTNRYAIVLYDEHWEAGVLGLAAARLANDYHRPVVMLTKAGDVLKGSARSVGEVNLFACLVGTSSHLVTFGGHKAAAGLSLSPDQLRPFTEAFCREVEDHYLPNAFLPTYSYDFSIDRDTVTNSFFEQLQLIEPCGEGNPSPRMHINSSECKWQAMGNGHAKYRLNSTAEVVAFGGEYLVQAGAMGLSYDLCLEASRRTFNNREYIQLAVRSAVGENACPRDSAGAFGQYLKTMLYPPAEVGVRSSTLEREVRDQNRIYGTLWVAFGEEGALGLRNELERVGKSSLLVRTCVGVCDANPLNTLLVAPTSVENWQHYDSIVFLDAPLSKGYLAHVGRHNPRPELVLLGRYAYKRHIQQLHLDAARIEVTRDCLLSRRSCHSLQDLCMQLTAAGIATADAYAHFYVLFDLGIVRVGEGFRLTVSDAPLRLETSRVYKTLRTLQERL